MLADLLIIVLALALLWLGAEGLVTGGASLAIRLGLTPLIVGLTIVSYGTSAPELVVSIKASLDGQSAIAMGNVVGSNIFNICLILGLAAAIQPLTAQRQLVRVDTPIMIGVSALLLILLVDGVLGRVESIFLLIGIIVYTVANIRVARAETQKAAITVDAPFTPKKPRSMGIDIAFIVAGLGILVLGSNLLVESAIALARGFGISEAVIGLTIVAAGTSMPELATSVVAALRKQADIAIGNIVGSNIYNILGILGVAGTITPLSSAGITYFDLGFMMVSALVLFPLMRSGFTIRRWEGIALMAIYVVYLFFLWPKE